MHRPVAAFLSALFIIGFIFFAAEKVFPQANQQNKSAANDSLSPMPGEASAAVKGITRGRARALVGVVAGLISLGLGWRAKSLSAKGANSGRTAAIVALALGLTSVVLSVFHLSVSAGAVFGSGSGKAGALFALLLSFLGITFGGLALRFRKVG